MGFRGSRGAWFPRGALRRHPASRGREKRLILLAQRKLAVCSAQPCRRIQVRRPSSRVRIPGPGPACVGLRSPSPLTPPARSSAPQAKGGRGCQPVRGTGNSPSVSPTPSSLPAQREGRDWKGEGQARPEREPAGGWGEATPVYGACACAHGCTCEHLSFLTRGDECVSWSCPHAHTPAPLWAPVLSSPVLCPLSLAPSGS